MLFGWDEKKWLTKALEVLNNKCAKLTLNMKPYESSMSLESIALEICGLQAKLQTSQNKRCYTFNTKVWKVVHNIQTRSSEECHLPEVKANWGKQASSYQFIDDWNKLVTDIKSAKIFITLSRGLTRKNLYFIFTLLLLNSIKLHAK